MSKVRDILRLYTQGVGKKKISARTGVARNTVKSYISQFIAIGRPFSELDALPDLELDQLFNNRIRLVPDERHSKLIAFFPEVDKALRQKKKNLTRESKWKEYMEKNPDGYRLTQFKELYRRWSKRANSIMHIDHKAGDKMYVDYAGKTLSYVDDSTGELLQAEVFVAILGASQLTYVEAVRSQKTEDFILGCEDSLHYFGGSPSAIVPDNLKAAVITSSRYEPVLNEVFRDFVHHYNMTGLPAGPYKPTHKALVEGAVKLIYASIYPRIEQRRSYTLDELNTEIWAALEDHNNRQMKARPYSRRQMFEEVERQALQPLPLHRYELMKKKTVTAQRNNHVCLHEDKHYYSVPFRFIGRRVTIQYNQNRVEIFYKYECIARHDRDRRAYGYTTIKDHLASNHQFLADWNPDLFLSRALEVGPKTYQYITAILDRAQHVEQRYRTCQGILSYAGRIGKARLESACNRALYYNDYSYKTITAILKSNQDVLPLGEELEEMAMPQHENIRGGNYYES